jgi:hypothetical protein
MKLCTDSKPITISKISKMMPNHNSGDTIKMSMTKESFPISKTIFQETAKMIPPIPVLSDSTTFEIQKQKQKIKIKKNQNQAKTN